MSSSRSTCSEDVWDQHKAEIKRLYLDQDMSQPALLDAVRRLGLSVTKSQLEHRLKLWKLRKNIKQEEWQWINKRIAKRKLEGKDSEVILCGKRIKVQTVQKETYRHAGIPTFRPPPSPQSPNDTDICIRSPQPAYVHCPTPGDVSSFFLHPQSVSLDVLWPTTLPWLRFRSAFAQVPRSRTNLTPCDLATSSHPSLASTSAISIFLGASTGTQPLTLCRLASTIAMTLPGSSEESNRRAEIITNGTEPELSYELLMASIFDISNNLDEFCSATTDTWDRVIDGLRKTGVMDGRVDFARFANDATFGALRERLFGEVFHRALKRHSYEDALPIQQSEDMGVEPVDDNNEPTSILRWLLSVGQNPNTCVWMDTPFSRRQRTLIPLEVAVSRDRQDLVKLLLEFGASPAGVDGKATPLVLAIRNVTACGPVPEVVHLLLESHVKAGIDLEPTFPSYRESLLHLAVRTGNLDLVRTLVEHGATYRGCEVPRHEWSITTKWRPLDVWSTPIGMAAVHQECSIWMPLVHYLWNMSTMPGYLMDDIVTAAAWGNEQMVEFFHDLHRDINRTNRNGVTPILAATASGHESMCELLVQLGAIVHTPSDQPSPLHIASVTDRSRIIDLLLFNGAKLESIYIRPRRETSLTSLWRRYFDGMGPQWDPETDADPATPLDYVLRYNHSAKRSAAVLVQRGAQIDGRAVLTIAARHLNVRLLRAALDRGEDPNQRNEDGLSPLRLVLDQEATEFDTDDEENQEGNEEDEEDEEDEDDNMDTTKRMKMASALLRAGASLEGGELVSAMRLGLNFVKLLMDHGAVPLPTESSATGILEAAILSKESATLALVERWYPRLYEPGALCAAVSQEWETWDADSINVLLGKRPLGSPLHPLESTAVIMAVALQRSDLVPSLLKSLPLTNREMRPPKPFQPTEPHEPEDHGRRDWLDDRWPLSFSDMRSTDSALTPAVINKDKDTLLQLLKHGFEPTFQTICSAIHEERNSGLTRFLIDGLKLERHHAFWNTTCCFEAFLYTVERGDHELMELFLVRGVDIRTTIGRGYRDQALRIAAKQGYLGIARQLLQLEADPNAPAPSSDWSTMSPLFEATMEGRIDMIGLLLAHGAETTGKYRPQYVKSIMYARAAGHHTAADLLVRHGGWTTTDEDMCARWGWVR